MCCLLVFIEPQKQLTLTTTVNWRRNLIQCACGQQWNTGDLNLDRLRPDRTEGNILLNLEEVYGLECLIKDPTRITPTLETLLDVILTNKPELFKASGVLNPEISDHHLVYGIMKERVYQHERKVVTFRSTRTLDVEKFNEDLSCAPWNVMDTFDTLDEKYYYWESLFKARTSC